MFSQGLAVSSFLLLGSVVLDDLFIHSPSQIHLGGFQIFNIMNKVATSIGHIVIFFL